MFTIRFETHNLQAVDYCVYQCDNYRVFRNNNRTSTISLYDGSGNTPPRQFDVGMDGEFLCAYVTNERGRTIDTIRSDASLDAPTHAPPADPEPTGRSLGKASGTARA